VATETVETASEQETSDIGERFAARVGPGDVILLHGDLAEADEGEVALVASDMATRLGDAVMELTARRQVKRES